MTKPDRRAELDAARERCPVRREPDGSLTVLRHDTVLRVLHDPDTFGNRVGGRRNVPNGIDPPEHGPWRAAIEPFFGPDRMAAYAPTCRALVRDEIATAVEGGRFDAVELGRTLAPRLQAAFLGWPDASAPRLGRWIEAQTRAAASGDRPTLERLGQELASLVRERLDARRDASGAPCPDAPNDPTTDLLRLYVEGRTASDADRVSIVTNWTVGELGTIAASIGVVTHLLAARPDAAAAIRDDAQRAEPWIEEALRIDAPLPTQRRSVRTDTSLLGVPLASGDRLQLSWVAANRDPRAFDRPEAADPDRPDAGGTPTWGSGVHVCPGRPLAMLQLETVATELVTGSPDCGSTRIALRCGRDRQPAASRTYRSSSDAGATSEGGPLRPSAEVNRGATDKLTTEVDRRATVNVDWQA